MIFDLRNNEPTITIEGIFIPEFRAIWDADKSKEKIRASQALSYVYHMGDFTSSYSKMPEEDRASTCEKDYLIDKPTDKEWEMITQAIEKYKFLQETHSMRLLHSAKYAITKFTEYFYNIDFAERDLSGKPVHNSRDLSSNLEKLGKIVTSLNDLEEVVNKERASAKKITGNATPSTILE